MEEIKGNKADEVKFFSDLDLIEFGIKLSELILKLHINQIIHCDIKPENIII